MKCEETRRYLDPFLDGEIEVETNMKVLEHLNLCSGCSRVYEGEKALRGVLKERLFAKAPPELEGRIRRRFAAAENGGWRRRMPTALAAGMLVGLVTLILFSNPAAVSAKSLAERMVAHHDRTRESPREVSICVRPCCAADDQKALRDFYRTRLSYRPCLHDLRALGYDPCYGSVWEVETGKRVCWTNHRHRTTGRVLSHASVSGLDLLFQGGEAVPMGKTTARLFLREGRAVLCLKTGEGIYCLIVFEGRDEAERFLRAPRM